jgi:fumarate hydratase class II
VSEGGASEKLRVYSIEGIELDTDRIEKYAGGSRMLVTALSLVIGYDKASAIAHKAQDDSTTLRKAALASGVSKEAFDRVVVRRTWSETLRKT